MRFLDCFAGIGGFRMGLEMAGHECVGHVEMDKYCNQAYNAIYKPKGDEFFGEDITKVDTRELPDFDILCGGFPCQAFSVAGKRRGFEDTRGTLIFELLRIAKEKRPPYLLFENVRGLLSHDKGRTFGAILMALDEIGYDVQWQLLNSKHFGVPQNRERVYIVGYLRRGSRRPILPLRQNDRLSVKTDESNSTQPQTEYYSTTIRTKCGSRADDTYITEPKLKQIIGGAQGCRVYDSSGISCTLSSQGGGMGAKTGLYVVPVLTPDRPNKRQNGRRFKTDGEPMFTLTAQDRHGVVIYQRKRGNNSGGVKEIAPTLTKNSYEHNNLLIQGFRIRKLTPRECWRLQGFPDWAFDSAKDTKLSDTQLYKQAGNAVTVNVICEIGKELEI